MNHFRNLLESSGSPKCAPARRHCSPSRSSCCARMRAPFQVPFGGLVQAMMLAILPQLVPRGVACVARSSRSCSQNAKKWPRWACCTCLCRTPMSSSSWKPCLLRVPQMPSRTVRRGERKIWGERRVQRGREGLAPYQKIISLGAFFLTCAL